MEKDTNTSANISTSVLDIPSSVQITNALSLLMMMKMTKTKMMVIATQLLLKKDVSMNIEQAHKAQKCNSYLQI